jgi:HupE / UreJ protein
MQTPPFPYDLKKLLPLWLVLVCLALPALAHPILQDTMWVDFEPALVRVAVNVSLKEIHLAQGIAAGPDHPMTPTEVDQMLDRQGDYLLGHLTLSSGEKPLKGWLVKLSLPPEIGDAAKTFYQYELVYPLDGPPPPIVTIRNDMLGDRSYAAGTTYDQSYVVRAKRYDATEATAWLLTYGESATIPTGWAAASASSASTGSGTAPAATVSAPEKPSLWQTLRAHLWHGIMHILTGYDHLLFVSALVIATRSFWEMVKVIAAFTLAHSLTLALCVFGIFRLPASIVEPVIALSIVFVSVENLFWPQRTHSKVRLLVAFGFGLIHGLGFAGGLLDAMAGLPAAGIWIALIGFSLGVEISHQIVVLPLFGLVRWMNHKLPAHTANALLRYGCSAISCGGAYYLFVAVRAQYFAR